MRIQYEIMRQGVWLTRPGKSAPLGGTFWVEWSVLTDRERERMSSWLRNHQIRSTGKTEGRPEIGDGVFEEGRSAPPKAKPVAKEAPESQRRYPIGPVEIIAAAIDGDADALDRMDEAGQLIAEDIASATRTNRHTEHWRRVRANTESGREYWRQRKAQEQTAATMPGPTDL